jgi:glycosyltransferase involved in cell wall biosynthesis
MSLSETVLVERRDIDTVQAVPKAGQRALSVAIYLHDLAGGGVERQSLIIAEELRQNGIEVILVLHRLRGQLIGCLPSGLRVVDLESKRTLQDIPRLVGFLRRERPDVLISNVDLNNIAALLAKAASFTDTKVVICQHNPISPGFAENENWMYRYVARSYRMLRPLIGHAVAVSQGISEELASLAAVPKKRISTINNPVVGSDFRERADEAAFHPWFEQPGRPVFVTAGRLVPQKDHATMLRALALHRKRCDGRLIVLGSGARLGMLQELTRTLGIADAVDFLGFRPNALPYFRQADAFVLSSHREGFGNVIVEALGCGTPVISIRCDHGPAEILDEGRYGLLVEQGSDEALAAAMDQVGTLRERFPADMLRQRAEAFTYGACSARYVDVLRALVPNRTVAA